MSDYSLEDLPIGVFKPVKVPVSAAGAAPIPLAGAIRLGGWSFAETTGAAVAQVELWDGGPGGGETVALVSLAAGGSTDRSCPGLGVLIQSGLSVNVLVGSVRGSVWVARA